LPPRAGVFNVEEVRKARRKRYSYYALAALVVSFASFNYKFQEAVTQIGNPYQVEGLHKLFWLRVFFGRTRSRLTGMVMEWRVPVPARVPLYSAYAWATGADLSEVRYPLDAYYSLAEFFSRTLVDGARPVADVPPNALTSPADCTVLATGDCDGSRIEQIKGASYYLPGFLGTDIRKRPSTGTASKWRYCVLYLAPSDYHHFHSPCQMSVHQGRHFAGELAPVNPMLLKQMPDLFAVNERVVLTGSWCMGGFFYAPVGAYNVGKITLDFDRRLRTNNYRSVPTYHGGDPSTKTYGNPHRFARGERLGGFRMGSSVVLVFETAAEGFEWDVTPGERLRVGEKLAHHVAVK
jgi:phosphatidylserine decarboxylase